MIKSATRMDEHPDLAALRARLDEEERAYASLLAALDALAGLPLPAQRLPALPGQMERLNQLWSAPPPPEGGGMFGRAHRRRWKEFAPAFQRIAKRRGKKIATTAVARKLATCAWHLLTDAETTAASQPAAAAAARTGTR